jgi:hypothetical protein
MPLRRFRLDVNWYRLEYDRDYGINRRSGWTAVVDGSVLTQFVTLWRALGALWSHYGRGEEDDA